MSKKIKRLLVVPMLLVILASMVFPVAAALNRIYLPEDHIVSTQVDGDEEQVYFQFPVPGLISVQTEPIESIHNAEGQLDYDFQSGVSKVTVRLWPLGVKHYSSTMDGGVIDITDFKKRSVIGIKAHFKIRIDYRYYSTAPGDDLTSYFNSYWKVAWYDVNGNFLTETTSSAVRYDRLLTNHGDSEIHSSYAYPLDAYSEIQIPEGAVYMLPVVQSAYYLPSDQENSTAVVTGVSVESWDFNMAILKSLVLEQSETLEAIEEKMDQLLQQPEQEKQEASNSGNSSVGELTQAIPDKSQGFIAAVKELTDAMSYDGTVAVLKFPGIYIPEIPGLFPRYDIIGAQGIFFEQWINKIPANILKLVRTLLTIGLIVYCFKELYDIIEYVLTLRSSGSGGRSVSADV